MSFTLPILQGRGCNSPALIRTDYTGPSQHRLLDEQSSRHGFYFHHYTWYAFLVSHLVRPALTAVDLSEDARILYSSDSIFDILGFTPHEVVNRSVWDWFHPDEVPLAKKKHKRGIRLDKAAVLAYARIMNKNGDYVGCECCFSVVYDVMVCCTSIYRQGASSQRTFALLPIMSWGSSNISQVVRMKHQ